MGQARLSCCDLLSVYLPFSRHCCERKIQILAHLYHKKSILPLFSECIACERFLYVTLTCGYMPQPRKVDDGWFLFSSLSLFRRQILMLMVCLVMLRFYLNIVLKNSH